jgi:ParB-like chromosome segregation protein Spo0J
MGVAGMPLASAVSRPPPVASVPTRSQILAPPSSSHYIHDHAVASVCGPFAPLSAAGRFHRTLSADPRGSASGHRGSRDELVTSCDKEPRGWVRDLADASAYMLLVTANAQSELTPIERGRHALGSDMDVKAYAESVGRARTSVQKEVYAAKVAEGVPDIGHAISGSFSQLVEIHAAPEWLWSALVSAMVEGEWSVEQTRKKIAALGLKKGVGAGAFECPPYLDIAEGLVAGKVKVSDIARVVQAERDMREEMERIKRRAAEIADEIAGAFEGTPEQQMGALEAAYRRARLLALAAGEAFGCGAGFGAVAGGKVPVRNFDAASSLARAARSGSRRGAWGYLSSSMRRRIAADTAASSSLVRSIVGMV